ncbi:MAG: SDR family NAD(P)-dependent oxidoreductase, partial [Oceanipulchritudo sp.]
MDIAIVTGASSSLGLAISSRLIQLGFRVYGLGGDYKECPLRNVNFKPVSCDLADPEAIEEACRKILEAEKGVYVVINNAKFFGRRPFQEMDAAEMERILRINLLCPLVLSRILAPSLKTLQGYFIQLGSPYADASRGGPVGAAASGGLKWMGEVLFEEMREHGVKVSHLSPEPNRYREGRLSARPGARTEAAIDPEAVAQAIEQILQSQFGNIITELVLRPLRVSEPDQDPVVRLPYPEPKPVPYTVPREMIEAEEQLEDEQFERDELRREERRRGSKEKEGAEKPTREEKPRRKRESGRKDRKPSGREAGQTGKKEAGQPGEKEAVREAPPRKPSREPEARESAVRTGDGVPKPETSPEGPSATGGKRRRRSRRKPKPPKAEVGFLDRQGGPETHEGGPSP